MVEGRGEVPGGDGSDDPFPGVLEAVLVLGDTCQGLLYSPEQKKVRRCQIWQTVWMLQHLDPLCRHPFLHAGGHLDWRVVPVEPPLLLGYGGHILLHMLHELALGHGGVGGADG
jgi:hypothetical protein